MLNLTSGWLSRLRTDVAGNTLAMAAAAMMPLLAAVGGVVDASRYYMATARLQQACDSGALAARKAMGDNSWTEADRTQGLAFFDHNYPNGKFGLTGRTRDFTADADGTVTGTASGQMPTTIMQIFGHESLAITVTCSAEINISNTDILFVLDVTGSMNCPDDGSSCPNGNNGNVEHASAKIKGLRTAVMSFYDIVNGATSATAQVRYGIVPWSSGINVGGSIPAQYIASSHAYQTRVPEWNVSTTVTPISFAIDNVYNRGADEYWYYWYNPTGESGVTSSSACTARASASTLGSSDVYIDNSIIGTSIQVVSESISNGIRTRVITARGRFSKAVPIAWWSSSYSPPCFVDLDYYRYFADFQATITERVEETRTFSQWRYTQHTWDVSGMKTNGSVTLPTGASGADQTHTWDGCIEEAATTQASVFDPLPANAFDLNINLVPATEAQRWKPTLPNAVYRRTSSGSNTLSDVLTTSNLNRGNYFCPKAATRLTDIERDDLESYLSAANGFRAIGNTYYDIGMIWGARFISPNGIFAADNATAPNGDAIGRHIVFMTDGLLVTDNSVYTPYGVHWWDRRVTANTGNSATNTRHDGRFQAACKQAREENISIWVVAFGTTLTQNLINCATPGRAFTADDSEALEETFQNIAERIAALRLTN